MTDNVDNGAANELEVLKSRARLMGIEFSNNIKADTLRERIQAKLDGETGDNTVEDEDNDDAEVPEDAAEAAVVVEAVAAPAPVAAPVMARKLTKAEELQIMRTQLLADATKLVRLRITNLDPKKKDLPGEVITVANEYIGTIRKYVPFGEVTDEGYHVPHCIYEMLKARKFLNIRTAKDTKTGAPKVSTQWASEFALEVLPQLTEEELHSLAQAQIAAGSIETNSAM